MPKPSHRDALAECIVTLAEEIARASPDCADKAMRIIGLVGEMKLEPDRAAIQDAIEMRSADSDMSESQLHLTTSAVLSAVKRTPGG
jgi:hypothetical protein